MGGDGSYSKEFRGVPLASRTHIDTNMRINGHKVLLQRKNVGQSKNILNSNSENPIYVIAYVRDDGALVVHSVNVFRNHEICLEINLNYDADGEIVPYDMKSGKGSHAHRWVMSEKGIFERKQHDGSNAFEIPRKYDDLIRGIDSFNKKRIKWER